MTINLSMSAKLPPSYDGRVGWFRYEDLVRDWTTFTVSHPFLKNRLVEDAAFYCELQKTEQILLEGRACIPVQIPQFLHRRGNTEFVIFASKFGILQAAGFFYLARTQLPDSPKQVLSIFRQSIAQVKECLISRC